MIRLRHVAALLLVALLPAVGIAYGQSVGPQLKVGVLTSPAPHYQLSDETGDPSGFALDVWQQVARSAGLKYRVEIYDDWTALANAAKAGDVDVVPLLASDKKSAALFDFSKTIHKSKISIIVRKSNLEIRAAGDLVGHRVAVVRHHAGALFMRTFRGELSIVHDTLDEALNSVLNRTSHALIHQNEVVLQHARRRGVESLLTTIDPPLQHLDLAIAVRKGQPQLLAALNRTLTGYLDSDAFYEARRPWGGNPPPLVETVTIAKVLGALLAITIIGLGLWRHLSVLQLNTALSQSVAERQSAEDRFKDIAESASDWFFEQDKDLKFTFISHRFEAMTGIPCADLIGKTRWDDATADVGVDEIEKWEKHIATLEAHKDWRDFVYSLTTKDGAKRTITTSGKAIFDQNGTFQGYRGVGRDITKRMELEQALHQSQKMEIVGQLTGGIAHDFNNLLTVMVGNLEMLDRHLKDDTAAQNYVETASEAVEIGTQLTQRLLAFSRRQDLDPHDIDLNELVTGMVSLFRSSLGEPIRLSLQLDPDLQPVFADRIQLQNAVLNMVINARDAMPDGGVVTIKTSEVLVDEDFCATHPDASSGRYSVLRIEDTGTGISEENLERIVEPFFTTKDIGEGSGLGLSMVYGFASQSGGFLQIESELNSGTAIDVYLPTTGMADECGHALQPMPAQTEQPPMSQGETVLVVDDNPGVLQIAVTRLEILGYNVLQATNATEALDILRQDQAVDVLFSDIVMPGGMSGIDLAGEVSRTWPKIGLLFATGCSNLVATMDQNRSVTELGPVLRKPYKQHELAVRMRDVLDG